MVKATTIPTDVSWLSIPAEKTCYGSFRKGTSRNKVLEEIKNAPIDTESFQSRVKKGAYVDEFLEVQTTLEFSDSDLAEIPFALLEVTDFTATDGTGYKSYRFSVKEESEQTAN